MNGQLSRRGLWGSCNLIRAASAITLEVQSYMGITDLFERAGDFYRKSIFEEFGDLSGADFDAGQAG